MTSLHLPPIESIDVEDLLTLPEGYRYELHEGNLVIYVCERELLLSELETECRAG